MQKITAMHLSSDFLAKFYAALTRKSALHSSPAEVGGNWLSRLEVSVLALS